MDNASETINKLTEKIIKLGSIRLDFCIVVF